MKPKSPRDKDTLTTRTPLATLLIEAACENFGFEYIKTSSAGKSVFSFPGQTYPVAMDVLRLAAKSACCGSAALAIAKHTKFTK